MHQTVPLVKYSPPIKLLNIGKFAMETNLPAHKYVYLCFRKMGILLWESMGTDSFSRPARTSAFREVQLQFAALLRYLYVFSPAGCREIKTDGNKLEFKSLICMRRRTGEVVGDANKYVLFEWWSLRKLGDMPVLWTLKKRAFIYLKIPQCCINLHKITMFLCFSMERAMHNHTKAKSKEKVLKKVFIT